MKKLSVPIGVMLVLALAVGAYLALMRNTVSPKSPAFDLGPAASSSAARPSGPRDTTALPETLKPHRTPPAGQKEYYNETYRISLFYPDTLAVKEYDENGGAMTITFQNSDTQNAEGFQIFVLPYGESQITEERFRTDEPSGIRKDPTNVSIDGVPAVSFYSTNIGLGETAEIWFIQGGHLFEVTTVKPLAPWLSSIMGTWQFL